MANIDKSSNDVNIIYLKKIPFLPMKETRGQRLWKIAETLGGVPALAKIMQMKPPGVYKYLNDVQSIGKMVGKRLDDSGINYNWYLTGLGSMFADGAAGSEKKKKFGGKEKTPDVMREFAEPSANPRDRLITEMRNEIADLRAQVSILQETIAKMSGRKIAIEDSNLEGAATTRRKPGTSSEKAA